MYGRSFVEQDTSMKYIRSVAFQFTKYFARTNWVEMEMSVLCVFVTYT